MIRVQRVKSHRKKKAGISVWQNDIVSVLSHGVLTKLDTKKSMYFERIFISYIFIECNVISASVSGVLVRLNFEA